MVEYTFGENTEMLIIYGEVRRNGRAAQRIYEERFPHRRTPSHTIFVSLQQRLRETGTFQASKADCGVPRTRRTLNFEENVLQHLDENSSSSTRTTAHALDVPHTSVWRVLHEQQLHPYHLKKVRALDPVDVSPRAIFCTWFPHQCVDNPEFHSRILFTDEALFTKEAVLNCRNSHIWDDANPHATCISGTILYQCMGWYH